MGLFMRWFHYFFLSLYFIIPNSQAHSIDKYLNQNKTNPKALYVFFKKMPKGGELHYHLAGGAYPEAMVTIGAKNNYCLDATTLNITNTNDSCKGIPATALLDDPVLYQKTIQAWSLEGFEEKKEESGHDHFFASFTKFMPIVADFRPQLLAEIMQRAASQYVLYMEIMILPDNAHSASFGALVSQETTFSNKQTKLLQNTLFNKNLTFTIAESSRILKQAKKELNCDTSPQQAVCDLSIKFQYYILREQPIDSFFAQALNGFAASARSNDLVGINLVQAEDGVISRTDYRKQMQIIQFLHTAYPSVHISLHAGELTKEMVNKYNAGFHIHDAIFTGHAERIGHGVSIMHEGNVEALLSHMAKNPVPVEINLTSNRKILNVSGQAHPLNFYLSHHVPIVLSTDDEGVLRTNITSQYVEAVREHGLDYATIKKINRNAITYSFLPGESLWKNKKTHQPVNECNQLNSASCQTFISKSQKARLEWKLEKQLLLFEDTYQETVSQTK